MAWDTTKTGADKVLSADWNNMVIDQKSRAFEAIPVIGTPAVDTRTELDNSVGFTGRISGGTLSDSPTATKVRVAAGAGLIRTTDSVTGVIKSIEWAQTDVDLTDGYVNYIYIDYDITLGGVPKATTTRADITFTNKFTLGRVYYDTTHTPTRRTIQSGTNIWNLASRMHERELAVEGFQWVSGATLTQPASMKLKTTDGSFYLGINPIATTGKDTTGADRFILWYRKVGDSGWNEVAPAASLITNQWDDNTGTINTTVTNNRYTVQWIYILYDGSLNVVLGRSGAYTLAEAQAAQAPSLPTLISSFGILIAKAIIAKDSSAITEIQIMFDKSYVPGSAANHADLTGLAYADAGHTGFCIGTHFGYLSRQAGGMAVPDTNPANYATNILPTNGFPEISVGFTGDDEEAYDVVLMPRDWTGGTGAGAVTIIIEFSTTSSATDKGAKFEVWGKRIAAGVVNTTALDLLATTALALNGGANFNNNTVEINLAAMAGAGRKIQLMFKRDKTGESTDTIPAEVKLTAYELKYIKTPAA